MAFKDLTRVFYDGKVKIDYKDRAHRYYARMRVDFKLPEDDTKAWGEIMYPKGVTTLIDQTLEKKGLMQWPKGLALRELFGFYDFTNDDGEQKLGFSADVGTLWDDGHLLSVDRETALPLIKSAGDAWKRKQKKGADIGSVVHDAIEHYVKNEEFDIAEAYNWTIKESEFESEALKDKAFEEAPFEVEQAKTAFLQFEKWWLLTNPTLHSAEDILYSMEHNMCGTYDADLSIPVKHHPVYSKAKKDISAKFHTTWEKVNTTGMVRCTTDWKTSNASKSLEAASPEGVYYSYFLQDALYELMRREMKQESGDDTLVVSARKDGGFNVIFASELGLTVEECLDWARAVIVCYRLADKSKKGLLAHAEPKLNDKEAF